MAGVCAEEGARGSAARWGFDDHHHHQTTIVTGTITFTMTIISTTSFTRIAGGVVTGARGTCHNLGASSFPSPFPILVSFMIAIIITTTTIEITTLPSQSSP